jgi:hypothetical protein
MIKSEKRVEKSIDIFSGKTLKEIQLERSGRGTRKVLKFVLKKKIRNDMDWINLAQNWISGGLL